jgi:hypothetical protein
VQEKAEQQAGDDDEQQVLNEARRTRWFSRQFTCGDRLGK